MHSGSDFFQYLNGLVDESSDAAAGELIRWMRDAANEPGAFPNKDAALQFYWSTHPRFGFLKCADHEAKFLDVGAGSGGLMGWKGWMFPVREDIRYYANDLSKGEFFDRAEGHFVHDLSSAPLEGYDGYFDAVFACHVIEHVPDWDPFFDNLLRTLRPGGTLYLEWPTERSAKFPRLGALLAENIPSSTVNFTDDSTHLHTRDLYEVLPHLERRGMAMTAMGTLRNGYLGSELIRVGMRECDAELNTYGLWMGLGFSQYIITKKAE